MTTAPVTPHTDALIAAVDGLVYNALSGVGARLLTKPACPRSERARAREITPAELHTRYPVDAEDIDAWHLLDGAWRRVPEIATRYGVDADCLTATLDEYARALIAARLPHSFDLTRRLLNASCLAGAQ